jgi:two-component system response regulator DevR
VQPYAGETLRVFLLDDHDLVRRGLRDVLAPARDLQVVGDSASARTAPRAILDLGVHVMVLDLQLQDGTGIEVCRAVRAVDPSVRGLLLTSAGDDEALAASVLAGAAGYLVKLSNSIDVIDAVRRVGVGRALLDASAAAGATAALRSRAAGLVPALTADEWAVLDDVLGGRTDAQVAERSGTSVQEASTRVAGLVRRLTAA